MNKTLKLLFVTAAAIALPLTLTACGGTEDVVDTPTTSTPADPQIGEGPIVDMTFEELDAALEGFGLDRDVTTYEDVAEFLGVYALVDEEHSEDILAASWYACDEGYATIFFVKETGLYSSWSTSEIGRP
jgi:hypothetical protein